MNRTLAALLAALLLSACASPPPKPARPRPSTWITIDPAVDAMMDQAAGRACKPVAPAEACK